MSKQDVTVRLPQGGVADRISAAVDRLAARLARHWLALFNTIVAVFVLLPFLAPLLMHLGLGLPARAIYLVYSPTCHQLPERSFFLFGPQGAYSVAELEAEDPLLAGASLAQRLILRYVGSPEIGYKVAICERDVAIYGSLLLGGLLFGVARSLLARRGRHVPKLPVKVYLIFLIPIAVDGVTQLMGLRESTWQLRFVTGMLFGLATVWLAYPHIDDAMRDSLKTMPAERAIPTEGTP
jgi:uncharacterized membrane protein